MSDAATTKPANLLCEEAVFGVLLITLNRPQVLNAMTYDMLSRLARFWDEADRDADINVVVITGAGRAFRTGNDLNNPDPDAEMARRIMDDVGRVVRGMVECSKPVISAINGVAVGAGAMLALVADISIAAEDARIVDGLVNVGVTSGDHAPLIWPLLCSMPQSKYYFFNLKSLSGQEAERLGLVTKAVPREQVLTTALEIAERMCGISQVGIRGTKRALNGWLRRALPIFEHGAALEIADFFYPDVLEARAAFRDKRVPEYPSAR